MPSDPKDETAVRILMIRMLGNDLSALHGETQTYDNLKFTLEHELCLPHITKHYVLTESWTLRNRKASKRCCNSTLLNIAWFHLFGKSLCV